MFAMRSWTLYRCISDKRRNMFDVLGDMLSVFSDLSVLVWLVCNKNIRYCQSHFIQKYADDAVPVVVFEWRLILYLSPYI